LYPPALLSVALRPGGSFLEYHGGIFMDKRTLVLILFTVLLVGAAWAKDILAVLPFTGGEGGGLCIK
jgi:hypothetical protein